MKYAIRLHSDQLPKRLCGVFVGLGMIAIGLYSLIGSADQLDELTRDRAFWFGISAALIGLIAVIVSLTVKNLDNIWCRQPRRW